MSVASSPKLKLLVLMRFKMKKLVSAVVVGLGLSLIPTVQAQAPVQGTMEAYVVEIKNDKEVLKAAHDVEPNQLVEYHLTYVNKSNAGINGLTVIGPVPEGTAYVSDTAMADSAASLKVSIDDGLTFENEPVTREVVKENGEVMETVIPPERYTHIQWQASSELSGKGGKQFYRYRVRVK